MHSKSRNSYHKKYAIKIRLSYLSEKSLWSSLRTKYLRKSRLFYYHYYVMKVAFKKNMWWKFHQYLQIHDTSHVRVNIQHNIHSSLLIFFSFLYKGFVQKWRELKMKPLDFLCHKYSIIFQFLFLLIPIKYWTSLVNSP